jgi:hypothetical protein
MSVFLIVIVTAAIIGVPASIIAYLLLVFGRLIAGITGMKVGVLVAVSIAAIPLFWAMMQYWRIWMAGISLRPQYGDQVLSYVFLVGFILAPMVVVAFSCWLWKKHLPPTP